MINPWKAIAECDDSNLGGKCGFVLYSTAEPCFMCSYVIRQAEIGKVVYAVTTPLIGGATSAFPILTSIELNAWTPAVLTIGGVLAEEVLQLRGA